MGVPNDTLMEAYELACIGDFGEARKLLAGLDGDEAAEMIQLIAALESGEEMDDMAAIESNPFDLQNTTRVPPPRPGREVDPVPLRCLQCGQTDHLYAQALVNTSWVTFFGFDEINASARCALCAACGHLTWFLPAAPGALQALGESHPAAPPARPTAPEFECRVCRFNLYWSRRGQLNTRALSFLGLDFLNRSAQCDVCARCGHIHWHLGRASWEPVVHAAGACLGCGGLEFSHRTALLNTGILTALGLDWLDAGTTIKVCTACTAIGWYDKR